MKTSTQGTPKSLRQAIFNAFEAQGVIATESLINEILERVRDYLAQKFQVPFMKYQGETSSMIKNLFKEVCK